MCPTCYNCVVVCNDAVKILPDGLDSHHYYHTVEGRDVTFLYKCRGANVINHWEVDGRSISEDPPNDLKFNLSNSSVDCVNTLTLTLYDVTMDYPTTYTAYPSSAERINTTGVHIAAHLSELFLDWCMCMLYVLSWLMLLCSTKYIICTCYYSYFACMCTIIIMHIRIHCNITAAVL